MIIDEKLRSRWLAALRSRRYCRGGFASGAMMIRDSVVSAFFATSPTLRGGVSTSNLADRVGLGTGETIAIANLNDQPKANFHDIADYLKALFGKQGAKSDQP